MPRQASRKYLSLIRPTRMTLWDIIKYLGLQDSIAFCLDAGAPYGVAPGQEVSSAGTGSLNNAWFDLSGNNRHFTLSQSKTTTGTNAQFYGTEGRMSEADYFSAPDRSTGDYLSLVGSTFGNNFHQNNGAFTSITVFDPTTFTTLNTYLLGNANGITTAMDDGFEIFYIPGSNILRFVIDLNTGASDATLVSLTATNAWARGRGPYQPIFAGVAFNEATPSIRMRCNSFTTSSTPAASLNVTNAANPLTIGAEGDGAPGMDALQKFYMSACWTRQLTDAEMQALYLMIKQHRFPSMR